MENPNQVTIKRYIGRVKEDGENGDVELINPLNQFMAPSTF